MGPLYHRRLLRPIIRSDSAGQLWEIAIHKILIAGLAGIAAVVVKNQVVAKYNYAGNSKIDADPETTTKNKIINDQNGITGDQFVYGAYRASWNACETIAVHNAKVLMGKESTLSETMKDFQTAGAMPLDGIIGSNPYAIGKVLRRDGIAYSRVGLNEMDRTGTYIISYWTGPIGSPLHTVAVSYDGTGYTTYNLDGSGGESGLNPTDYVYRYVCGYYLG